MPPMRFKVNFPQGWAEGDYLPRVELADRSVPQRIDVQFPSVGGEPALSMRLEVIAGRPQIRELRISSVDGGREVREKDLRAVDIAAWVEDIFGACAVPFERQDDGSVALFIAPSEEAQLDAVRVVQDARRGTRKITADLLQTAARIYAENLNDGPIQAVGRYFNVSDRTASGYITRARSDGYLNKTKRGKKGI